jgi:hypothetical protein
VRRVGLAAGVLVLCASLGCALPFGRRDGAGPRPDPSFGVAEVEAEGIFAFYERASSFYDRLALRRFNSLGTYRDETLREFFRTQAAFSDYYADLAQALADAHFERNRPLSLEVVEMRLSGPGEAEVVARIVGNNGLPLRWWSTQLERVDRWERIQGQWWIVPSKL